MEDQREGRDFTLLITEDSDGSFIGEVAELPGCFASGSDFDELMEAAAEAINMYLADSSEPSPPSNVFDFAGKASRKKQERDYHVHEAKILLEA